MEADQIDEKRLAIRILATVFIVGLVFAFFWQAEINYRSVRAFTQPGTDTYEYGTGLGVIYFLIAVSLIFQRWISNKFWSLSVALTIILVVFDNMYTIGGLFDSYLHHWYVFPSILVVSILLHPGAVRLTRPGS